MADNGSAIATVSVDTWRLRLAAEASRTWALSGGGTLTPSLKVGACWDGGDGDAGAGMELGGGLEWTLPSRLSVEARGRTLVAHGGDVEEWGVSGSARLSPGSGGRGWSLALSPRWGASESGLARLWDEGMAGRRASSSGGAGTARLEAELGYGFGVWGGVMTPHVGFGYEEGGARRYRLGTRSEFGPDLAVGLEAERKEGAAAPEHGARIDLRLKAAARRPRPCGRRCGIPNVSAGDGRGTVNALRLVPERNLLQCHRSGAFGAPPFRTRRAGTLLQCHRSGAFGAGHGRRWRRRRRQERARMRPHRLESAYGMPTAKRRRHGISKPMLQQRID